MNNFINTATIPRTALIKPLYDTQKITQNVSEVNFYPANASKVVARNNYITNPFPGENTRRVVALSFEINKQFIEDDAANSIDSEAIINSLKDAGIILTADGDYKEFLRTTIDRHSNFSGTGLESESAAALVDAAIQTATSKVSVMKGSGLYFLADPFDIAPNQTVDLKVKFADSSLFPTDANWNDSGQGLLYMTATLYAAEIEALA